MSKLEAFLSTSIEDHKAFRIALSNAASELVAKQNGVSTMDIAFEGDRHALDILDSKSLYPLTGSEGPDLLRARVRNISDKWNSSGSVDFYRGTRLPDPGGSFDAAAVHASPDIHTAIGYGVGDANSTTGVGRLAANIGFLSTYQVNLDQRTYKNFEYEDSTKSSTTPAGLTVSDLANSVTAIANAADKNEGIFAGGGDIASEAHKKLSELTGKTGHYEVMVNPMAQDDLFMLSGKKIYRVERDDPEWQRLLSRLQEASLRDFFEIKPLDSALQRLSYAINNLQGDLNEEDQKFLANLNDSIALERKNRLHADFESKNLSDVSLTKSPYLDKRPYIANSKRVGSATSAETQYPDAIQRYLTAVDAIEARDIPLAKTTLHRPPHKSNPSEETPMDNVQAMNKIACRLMTSLTQPKPKSATAPAPRF